MNAAWTLWLPLTGLLWLLILGWTFHRLPAWSRPGLAFAVSVPAGFLEETAGRAIVARYRRAATAMTALAVLAALVLLAAGGRLAEWTYALLLPQIAGFTWAFLRARRAALPHSVHHAAGEPRQAALVRLPGGALGQAGPFVLLAAAAAWIGARMDGLPERIPVHYGSDLKADAWAAPSWAALIGPALVGVTVCTVLLAMSWAMTRRSRPPADDAQAARLTLLLRVLLGANYLVAFVFALIGLAMLRAGEELDPLFVVLLVVAPQLLGLGLLVWLLARFSRMMPTRTVERVLGDRSEDRDWKAGLIYYNPDDPSLFIEKRFGIGYTMNMARPATWWLLGAVIGLPLVVALLLGLLG